MAGGRVTRDMLRALHADLLREAERFASYNFREFFKRRATDRFGAAATAALSDAQADQLFARGQQELQVLRRQATINQFYDSSKLVIETPTPTKTDA